MPWDKIADSDRRWAHASELHNYDPFIPFMNQETLGNTPGLSEAYMMSSNALEQGLGLDYWRQQVQKDVIVISSDSDTGGVDSGTDAGEDSDDLTIQEAKRQSRLTFAKEIRHSILPSSPLSSQQRAKQSSTVLTISDSEEEDSKIQLPLLPRTAFRSTLRTSAVPRDISARNRPASYLNHDHNQSAFSQIRSTDPSRRVNKTVQAPPKKQTTVSFPPSMTTNQRNSSLSGQLPDTRNSDMVKDNMYVFTSSQRILLTITGRLAGTLCELQWATKARISSSGKTKSGIRHTFEILPPG